MEYFNNINNFDDIVKDLEKVLECKEIDEILIIIRDYELKILEYTTYNEQQKIILLEIESELKEIYSVYNSIKSFTEDEKNELDWSLIGDIYIKKSNLINNFLEQFGKINIDLEQTRLIILINRVGLSFVNDKYKFYFLIKINTAFNVVVHMRLLL